MKKYISLLRGINVSGQKKIKMTELKEIYRSLNFTNVTTYIQSGNVVFCSPEKNIKKIQEQIEQKIEEVYNFTVPTIIVKANKLKTLLSNIPFDLSKIDKSKLCFVFLDSTPDKLLVDNILHYNSADEKFVVKGDVIYLYSLIGMGKTKLTNNFFEKKLNVNTTGRNWNTTNKLAEMINELDCGN